MEKLPEFKIFGVSLKRQSNEIFDLCFFIILTNGLKYFGYDLSFLKFLAVIYSRESIMSPGSQHHFFKLLHWALKGQSHKNK